MFLFLTTGLDTNTSTMGGGANNVFQFVTIWSRLLFSGQMGHAEYPRPPPPRIRHCISWVGPVRYTALSEQDQLSSNTPHAKINAKNVRDLCRHLSPQNIPTQSCWSSFKLVDSFSNRVNSPSPNETRQWDMDGLDAANLFRELDLRSETLTFPTPCTIPSVCFILEGGVRLRARFLARCALTWNEWTPYIACKELGIAPYII